MKSNQSFFIKLLIIQCLTVVCFSQDFDFFYLVQQWPGSYCDSKQSCCYPTTGKPDADFGIHGLWPNYRDGSYPSNCDSNNPYDESEISDLIRSIQHQYFEAALDLKKDVDLVQILKKAGIRANGESYPLSFLNGDLNEEVYMEQPEGFVLLGNENKVFSKLSRFISNPSVEHWKAIGRVLGYLKNTKELSLQYSKFPAILEGYSDASWISSVGDNLSTTGWVFTLGGGAVSWGSKKQTCISHSTMEAEFIALAATGKEAEWLRDLMMDIPFTANNVSTVSIHCDSQATLARAYSGVYNGKSRHISIRHEYVRQLIQYGIISISFVRSSGNLADPFTKPLTRDLVRIKSRGMRLKLLK
ncbi:hypothetical protein VitviT2T_001172 [Vitis vinifera]|uniref:Uncharacterized protein n=2 Tax=Vitis vinifera TaxID=29760 RepID=A0ABY9BES4_VITVI|nr:hypothetical protein VitviT2T_001172 [Vitis vinifera]